MTTDITKVNDSTNNSIELFSKTLTHSLLYGQESSTSALLEEKINFAYMHKHIYKYTSEGICIYTKLYQAIYKEQRHITDSLLQQFP